MGEGAIRAIGMGFAFAVLLGVVVAGLWAQGVFRRD